MNVRIYPPGFGRVLQKLHGRFIKRRVVKWDLPADMLEQSLEEFFGALPWADLWPDANMTSVLAYLRGSYHLSIGNWRQFFPTEI